MSDYDVFEPGIIGAALTPFTAEGEVDLTAQAAMIEDLVTHCQAISVLGAEVTEYSVMSQPQRRETLRQVIEFVDGRVPVLAGASSMSTGEVVELAELAKASGARAIQVLMPNRPGGGAASTDELVAFFQNVSSRSALPIVAYHNPQRGTDTDAATMEAVARVPGVCGLKESSRDMTKIARLCATIDQAGHARYFTTMQPLLATLEFGGSGAMAPHPGTRWCAVVYAHYIAGRFEDAAAAQRVFSLFPGSWSKYGLAAVMKAALEIVGLDAGEPPAGFAAMDQVVQSDLAAHLTTWQTVLDG